MTSFATVTVDHVAKLTERSEQAQGDVITSDLTEVLCSNTYEINELLGICGLCTRRRDHGRRGINAGDIGMARRQFDAVATEAAPNIEYPAGDGADQAFDFVDLSSRALCGQQRMRQVGRSIAEKCNGGNTLRHRVRLLLAKKMLRQQGSGPIAHCGTG